MSLAAYLGIASGVALVATALGLALARPGRVGGWLFVAFLVAWGSETALFNSLGLVSDLDVLFTIQRIGLAVALVEALFLVHFAVRFTRSMDTAHRWWSWGALIYTAVIGGLIALRPGLFAGAADDSLVSTVLVAVPRFGAFFAVVGILASRYRDTRSQIEHREVRIVLLGLVLYVAYTAGFYLSLYGGIWALGSPDASQRVLMGLFLVASLFLVGVVWRTWQIGDPPEHWSERERTVLSAAVLVPMVLGLATGLAETADLPRVDLFGLLRIGASLLVAYGLVKFEIFEIDRRVKTVFRGSAVAGAFVVAFFVVSEGVEVLVSNAAGNWAGLAAAGLLTLGLRPIQRRASRLAEAVMPDVGDDPAYLESRKTDIYQAAVERAAGDEVLTERERDVLLGLRKDLGIGVDRAQAIEERVFSGPLAV